MYQAFALALVIIVVLIVHFYNNSPPPLPAGVANGDIIRCAATGRIYSIENNTKRWYSTDVYDKLGRPQYKSANCATVSNIPIGPDMQ